MTPEQLIEKERTLADYTGQDAVVHFTEYLRVKAEENEKVVAFLSGFKGFDEHLHGIATGEVTVLSGKTGEGKTLFAESLVKRIMERDLSVKACMFSFEVSPFALLPKYTLNPQFQLYLPLSLEAMNIEWLRDRVWEAKLKYGCQIFVFDHLHFLVDMSTKQNMSLNIGAFMRRLKRDIAIDLNVSVILIAHQKGVAKGDDPSLEDVRDSSFIAQEADNVIIVWRRADFTSKELGEMDESEADLIRSRMPHFYNNADTHRGGFAVVQIAKCRRTGTYRWPKLFQKTGEFLEEV